MATGTLSIPLSEEQRAFVEGRAAEDGCESAEAYVTALIEADYKRRARERLEQLLLEGIESGPATPMTPQDWDDLRRRVEQRLERGSGQEGGVTASLGVRP
jgi:antitoxin ParD1/3/4